MITKKFILIFAMNLLFCLSTWAKDESCTLLAMKKNAVPVVFTEHKGINKSVTTRFEVDLNQLNPQLIYSYNCYTERIIQSFGFLPSAEYLFAIERKVLVQYKQEELKNYLDHFLEQNGRFYKVDILHKILYSLHLQAQNFDLENSREFTAIVLRKNNKLLIFFGSVLHSEGVGRSLSLFNEEIQNLITNESWDIQFHIHNHPFYFDIKRGGYLAPSIADKQNRHTDKLLTQYSDLPYIVTNGIDYVIY